MYKHVLMIVELSLCVSPIEDCLIYFSEFRYFVLLHKVKLEIAVGNNSLHVDGNNVVLKGVKEVGERESGVLSPSKICNDSLLSPSYIYAISHNLSNGPSKGNCYKQ